MHVYVVNKRTWNEKRINKINNTPAIFSNFIQRLSKHDRFLFPYRPPST